MNGNSDASIVSLACARFEDALADDQLDDRARAHLMGCERCAALYDDLSDADGVLASIARATGPAPVPDGFADAVLRRALGDDADLLISLGAAAEPPPRSRRWWLAAGGLAAGVAAAVLFVVVGGPPTTERPIRAIVEQPTAPATAAVTSTPPPAEAPPRAVPVMLRPSAPAAALPAPAPPVVPTPAQVPERALDIPTELKAALLHHVKGVQGCPQASDGELRVTLTLDAKGKISNRQVLSTAGQGQAHQCVNRALDQLLLPPLDRAATVTIDVSW